MEKEAAVKEKLPAGVCIYIHLRRIFIHCAFRWTPGNIQVLTFVFQKFGVFSLKKPVFTIPTLYEATIDFV